MSRINELNDKIKHLEALQKRASDRSAQRRIALELVETVDLYNRERKRLNNQEAHSTTLDKNLDESKYLFDKLARGRKYV